MAYMPKIHMKHHDAGDRYVHASCRRVTDLWTTDPQVVTCQACIDNMDLQPA